MDWRQRTKLGKTDLVVSRICVGTSPLGNMQSIYGYAVDDDRALATLSAVFASPLNFIDTANGYGNGLAERRVGDAILRAGGLSADFIVATKADADPVTGDFSGDRIRRSIEESLERLGMNRLRLFHLHDPEFRIDFETAMSKGGAVPAMVKLKEEGIVDHIGVATGTISAITDYVKTGIFDVVLNHNRYTLLDRSAEPLLAECARRGIGFINAAPYGGGMLVKGPDLQPRYGYVPAPEVTIKAAKAMQEACAAHRVSLAAAALQFSLRDPRIACTVIGMTDPARLDETRALAEEPIELSLWEELESLVPPRETWLH